MAAAKKEAKVVVNTFPGDGYKRALKAFTAAYPDIKLEHTSLHSQDFAPRILQERQANLFTWDVALIPTSTALQVLRPAGVWDPVRPAIVLPEVKDGAWEGGFERGFALVKDRALCYGFVAVRGGGVTINTDLVKESEVQGLKDLLDPRWKGKLLLPDVRVMGDAFWPMTARAAQHGRRHRQEALRGPGAGAEPRQPAGGGVHGARTLSHRARRQPADPRPRTRSRASPRTSSSCTSPRCPP